MNPTAVSVALITNAAGELLWIWDSEEECFALPSTAVRVGAAPEQPDRAAQRAAARALGVPVTVGHHVRLESAAFVTGRDRVSHRFRFEVFRVSAHSDFAERVAIREPHLWLPVHRAISREFHYEPFSAASRWVVASLVHEGWLQGRIQHTTALVLRRVVAGRPQYLLRQEPEWGYALPGKRRRAGESYLECARRIARDELGVHPADVGLTEGHFTVVRDRAYSASEHADTVYFHGVFEATVPEDVVFKSQNPLVWVDLNTIASGALTSVQKTTNDEPAPPDAISGTVAHILAERNLML